jgi:hypothetical protein
VAKHITKCGECLFTITFILTKPLDLWKKIIKFSDCGYTPLYTYIHTYHDGLAFNYSFNITPFVNLQEIISPYIIIIILVDLLITYLPTYQSSIQNLPGPIFWLGIASLCEMISFACAGCEWVVQT